MNQLAGSIQQRFRESMTRRGALAALVVAGAVPLTASARQNQQAPATPAAAPPPAGTPTAQAIIGEATMPQWRFEVTDLVDPYVGTLTKPQGVPSGIRLIALQVVLFNESDQPLEFLVTAFRLRDLDGSEYRAGEYLGTEPRIVSQNLPDGERTRGWVWYGIPEAAQPSSIVFVAPPPVLKVSLTQ